jgi:hypothetical protein
MASNKTRTFDPQGRLVDQRESNLGVLVPLPISERLEALTEALDRAGHGRVARKELVGALLLAATQDTAELAELLRRYRVAKVRNAVVGQVPPGRLITFPQRAPGPRPRAS